MYIDHISPRHEDARHGLPHAAACALLTLVACGQDYSGFRGIDGTDGIMWRGGCDELIGCSYDIARRRVLELSVPLGHDQLELAGLRITVRDEDNWTIPANKFRPERLVDGMCTCPGYYSDESYVSRSSSLSTDCEVDVGQTMRSLAHELFEFYFFGWHGPWDSDARRYSSFNHPMGHEFLDATVEYKSELDRGCSAARQQCKSRSE